MIKKRGLDFLVAHLTLSHSNPNLSKSRNTISIATFYRQLTRCLEH